jgi:hypothetical protein
MTLRWKILKRFKMSLRINRKNSKKLKRKESQKPSIIARKS